LFAFRAVEDDVHKHLGLVDGGRLNLRSNPTPEKSFIEPINPVPPGVRVGRNGFGSATDRFGF
jgi:hypothetical protein